MVERTARWIYQKPKTAYSVIDKGPYGYQHINAAIQRRRADSLLNWTDALFECAKKFPRLDGEILRR